MNYSCIAEGYILHDRSNFVADFSHNSSPFNRGTVSFCRCRGLQRKSDLSIKLICFQIFLGWQNGGNCMRFATNEKGKLRGRFQCCFDKCKEYKLSDSF